MTTQEFLGSCIFLFVKHPYDVGDRVDIVGSEKQQLVVERISLLYTIFNRIDKMQIVQVPNIQLNNLWIENVTRSKAMKEVIDVNVSFDTSFEDIELLRAEMEAFVRHADNSRDFMPDLVIGVGSVNDLDKLTLKIAIKHKSNWHNDAVRATRRSKFVCALALALKKVPIHAPGGGGEALGGPTNPSYSVAVTDKEAARARELSDLNKDSARLVPTKKPERSSSTASNIANTTEMQAASNLNTMTAAALAAGDDWGFNRDDDTLGSRDPSTDRLEKIRSSDIERLRTDLRKSESTRSGRRQAGTTLSTEYYGSTPGIQVTQHSAGSGFDEEAQIGSSTAYYSPAQQFGLTSTSPPPTGTQTSAVSGPGSSNATGALAARSNTLQAASSRGSRPRGASVSRSQSNAQNNNPYQR